MLTPVVTRVSEADQVGANNSIIKVVQVAYTVGSHGPFTVRGTDQELRDGTIVRKMQDMADAIERLPGPQQ